VVERVGSEFPEVPLEVQIIDDFARRLVAEPHSLDVVVLPNLYGDILSDEAAALVGGLGLAPSGCYGDGYAYFEPAHGTAPDLVGKGSINPTATLLSGAMLLEHLGFVAEAARLEAAVDRVYAEGEALTPDQGGTAGTGAFCEAVLRALEG
jgi:isocitrate/isopropylmalate dehydrogenase